MWKSITRAAKRWGGDKPVLGILTKGSEVHYTYKDGSKLGLNVSVREGMTFIQPL